MPSSATSTFELATSPAEASAAVQRVIAENKHRLGEQSPDGLSIAFVTHKTMLSYELDAQAVITPTASGSQVQLEVDTVAGRPKAMMDGKKNRKSLEKLTEQIRAAAAG